MDRIAPQGIATPRRRRASFAAPPVFQEPNPFAVPYAPMVGPQDAFGRRAPYDAPVARDRPAQLYSPSAYPDAEARWRAFVPASAQRNEFAVPSATPVYPQSAAPSRLPTPVLVARDYFAVPSAAPAHPEAALRRRRHDNDLRFANRPEVLRAAPAVQMPELPAGNVRRNSPRASLHGQYDIVKSLDTRPSITGGMSLGVFLVRSRRTGRLYVEKRIDISKPSRKDRARAELEALQRIRTKGAPLNLNCLISDTWNSNTNICSLVLEYCDGGTIDNSIDMYLKNLDYIPESFIWHTFLSMAKALAFCHDGVIDPLRTPVQANYEWNKICHLDIKPQNVFLEKPDGTSWPRVVLGDFGCAVTPADVHAGKADPFNQNHGTNGWFPPENSNSDDFRRLLKHLGRNQPEPKGQYGSFTDIWQLGGLIMVMCKRATIPEQRYVDKGQGVGNRYGVELSHMVCCCMQRDWLARPKSVGLAQELVGIIRRVNMY